MTTAEIALRVDNLSKIYALYDVPVDRLKESLNPFRKKYHKDFYALKNITLNISKGEAVGIIGKNGSGKSTLLKILTGVLTPSAGHMATNGTISALLELGTGFNPDLTGIENIYFSGTIMGYSKNQMSAKLDDILSFADIGDFVKQPVKTYSSGMFVRLAFAVAITVDPDILIVDEALSVGDIRFSQKCYRKIKEFRSRGKTIIMVTHDTGAVISFCTRAVWLQDGEVRQDGNPDDVVKQYISFMSYGTTALDTERAESGKLGILKQDPQNVEDRSKAIQWEEVSACSSFGEGGAKITRVALYDKDYSHRITFIKGESERVVKFLVEFICMQDIESPIVGFTVKDELGNQILGTNSSILGMNLQRFISGNKNTIEFEFEFPLLRNGNYSISPAIAEGTLENHIQHHWVHDAYVVQLVSKNEAAKMGFLIPMVNNITINIF